jgi:hypothetical protein
LFDFYPIRFLDSLSRATFDGNINVVLFSSVCRCGNSQLFQVCKNSTQLISGSDVLSSVGIDLPVYCCVGTLIALVILLRILGYYAIKYKLYANELLFTF